MAAKNGCWCWSARFHKAEKRVKRGGIIIVTIPGDILNRAEHHAKPYQTFQSVVPCRPGVTSTDVFFEPTENVDFKALFGLTVIPAAILGGESVAACFSSESGDVFFVMLVFLTPSMELLDVNYVSRDWYRGTALGFQISVPDVLAISLLVSSVVPRRGQARLYRPPGYGLMIPFFLYACVSVGLSEPRLIGFFELFKMLRGFVFVFAVALYLRSERELRLFVLGLALLVCYEGMLAFKQAGPSVAITGCQAPWMTQTVSPCCCA